MSMTNKDWFLLGMANGLFSGGAIDAGIHMVLPSVGEDGSEHNEVFRPLVENYFRPLVKEPPSQNGIAYMGAIELWLQDQELALDDEPMWIGVYLDEANRF